jgi:hypothetical protein
MLATQWLDIFFVPLYLMGIETIEPVDPANPGAYGGSIIHAIYTHSLGGALALAAIAGGLAWSRWGKQVGVGIGVVAFSHWVLDLIVHRPDLPILPGNAGGLPLLGFGLWRFTAVSASVELTLVLAGAYLYYRAATRLPALATTPTDMAAHHRRVVTASAVVVGLMVLSLVTSIVGV